MNANQEDFRDNINQVLLNGLISGATAERQQLLTDQTLATAVPLVQQNLLLVIQYNLDAIEEIALMPNQCAMQPLQQSRVAIEKARDSALNCLNSLKIDPTNITAFNSCLQTVYPIAQQEINALKPSIDACLQSTGNQNTNTSPTQNVQNTNSLSQ